jgi:hypothetical protein
MAKRKLLDLAGAIDQRRCVVWFRVGNERRKSRSQWSSLAALSFSGFRMRLQPLSTRRQIQLNDPDGSPVELFEPARR